MIKVGVFLKDEIIIKSPKLIKQPKISVIMPTYCRGNNGLFERAVRSVLEQTFSEFELIIVDDGSTDKTREIVQKLMEQDDRIVYIRNDFNSGLPALRINQGLRQARAEYIAYQFDDDRWDLEALASLYAYITSVNADLVYGKCLIKAKDGSSFEIGSKFAHYKLAECNQFANNSVLHHRKLFEKYGAYECNLVMRRVSDWDLWYRWSKETAFSFLDKLISIVEINVENSLGETCVYDLDMFRLFSALENRNEKLKLENLSEYILDDLSFVPNANKIFNKHVYEWYLKRNYLFDSTPPRTVNDKKLNVIITKNDLASSIDITLFNFGKIPEIAEKYNFMFVPEKQLTESILSFCDILILHRTCYPKGSEVLKQYRDKIPIIYFIDDDLLNIYKLGEEFSYFAPGKLDYINLSYQLQNSDLVISYTDAITESVKPLNKKVLKLYTNILKRYVNKPIRPRGAVYKIAFLGGGARKGELSFIWDDLMHISQEYKDKVEFYFWGYIPERITEMKESKVLTEEFSSSYYEYLNRLYEQDFDIILSPLFEDQAKLAKSIVKLLESAVCNGIGIFSDIIPYTEITNKIHAVKVKNEAGEWEKAIRTILNLTEEKRRAILENARQYIYDKYLTEVQVSLFDAALESGRLHHYMKNDGKICYVFHSAYLGGAENDLLKHALLAKEYHFNILVCVPRYYESRPELVQKVCKENNIDVVYADYQIYVDPYDIDINRAILESIQFEDLAKKHNIKLFHAATLIPPVNIAANKMNIPAADSLHAIEKQNKAVTNYEILPKYIHSSSLLYSNLWNEVTGAFTTCIRSLIPYKYFKQDKVPVFNRNIIKIAILGTVQERKCQHKAIEAVGQLSKKGYDIELHVLGYNHFFTAYLDRCKEIAKQYGIEGKVFFKGFCEAIDKELEDVDAVICASDWESFPQVIFEGMAMKLAVISTPVAGVPELLVDGVTGYSAKGYEAEDISDAIERYIKDYKMNKEKLQDIIEKAFSMTKAECRPEVVAQSLFALYNKAVYG